MAIKTKVKRRFLTAAAAAGGLVLAAGLALYLCSGADGLDSVVLSVCFLGTSAAVLALLTGGGLLLLRRHIGAVILTVASAAVSVFASAAVIADCLFSFESGVCFAAQCVMCAGG